MLSFSPQVRMDTSATEWQHPDVRSEGRITCWRLRLIAKGEKEKVSGGSPAKAGKDKGLGEEGKEAEGKSEGEGGGEGGGQKRKRKDKERGGEGTSDKEGRPSSGGGS